MDHRFCKSYFQIFFEVRQTDTLKLYLLFKYIYMQLQYFIIFNNNNYIFVGKWFLSLTGRSIFIERVLLVFNLLEFVENSI